MDKEILNREIFLQIREELSGKQEKFVDIAPGIQARVVQLTSDAGFALIAMTQDEDKDSDGGKNLGINSYRWICACVVDDAGNPVFEMDDFKTLPFELVQRLARVVNEVNGLAPTGDGMEDAEKN